MKTICFYTVLLSILACQVFGQSGCDFSPATPPTSGCDNAEYSLAFEDNFDGSSLDLNKWEIKTGVWRGFDFDNELGKQWLLSSNVGVNNGTLTLSTNIHNQNETYDAHWDGIPDTNFFKFSGSEIAT